MISSSELPSDTKSMVASTMLDSNFKKADSQSLQTSLDLLCSKTNSQEEDSFETNSNNGKAAKRKRKFSTFSQPAMKHLAIVLNVLKHLGPAVALAGYTAIGAAIFEALELEREMEDDNKRDSRFRQLLKTVCEVSANVTASLENTTPKNHTSECTSHISPIVMEYMEIYFRGFNATNSSHDWDFKGSAFFALTVYTTIGYGINTPVTDYGRVAVIVYAMIGIPLNFYALADFGILLNRGLRHLWTKASYYFEKVKIRSSEIPTGDDAKEGQRRAKRPLPLSVAVISSFAYIFAGAPLFMYLCPDWNFLTSIYFCFQTFATIGFGDVMPRNRDVMLMSAVYIMVGMAMLSLCMAVITDNIRRRFAKYSGHIQKLDQRRNRPRADSEIKSTPGVFSVDAYQNEPNDDKFQLRKTDCNDKDDKSVLNLTVRSPETVEHNLRGRGKLFGFPEQPKQVAFKN